MREIDIKRMFALYLLKKEGSDVIFFEYAFHFGRRRADIISVEDGMVIAYEIKSAFDRIDRLGEQLNSYAQLFDYVYVICDSKHINAIRKTTPERIGIYQCAETGLKRIRKAKQIKNFDSITTLDAMPIEYLRKEFKPTATSKLEICYEISKRQKREDIKTEFRKYVIQKYGTQTAHLKNELSDILTLDDVYSLSLAPNKLGT
ncbi:sce7726 family protein [Pseudomonas sp.]|uniref:sce7726 family protein n=1 Tax=Pseudomonas sp. TaxID=306 RepID=UPI003CC5DA01